MRSSLIIVVMALLGTAGCDRGTPKDQVTERAVRVRIARVEQKAMRIPVRTTGILATSTQMKLSFKTGGLVKDLSIREGEAVRKGTVLAVLDPVEIEAQVDQARAGYQKAQRDLERAGNLYRDSVATLEQFQDARTALEMARSRKEIAEFNLLHSRITAPSDGRIQKILVETNEMIAPGYPAILFASTDDEWVVRVALTDKDIVKFTPGDSAEVDMDAFPGQRFRAVITELGSVSDPVTGTYEVELMLTVSLPPFRTGFFCRVELFPAEAVSAPVIPFESLLDASDDMAVVFVYDQGKVIRRRVRTGPSQGEMVVIREGLQPGEWVVTEGARYVRNDLEVLVADTLNPPLR